MSETTCPNSVRKCGWSICRAKCPATISHGPGHQSVSHCEIEGEHTQHRAAPMNIPLYWSGEHSFTGFFNTSPE